MPQIGLNRPESRPRGGVDRVELFPAPQWAGTDSQSVGAWTFCEDRARYRTEVRADGLVGRTLEMTFPSTAQGRAAVERLSSFSAGVVARIVLASGETVVAGWSERFGTAYPLRVVKTAVDSGQTPADFPTVTVTLECVS